MKKNFIAIAIALLTIGGTMSAQTPETTSTDNTTTTTTCQKQGRREGCKENNDREFDSKELNI